MHARYLIILERIIIRRLTIRSGAMSQAPQNPVLCTRRTMTAPEVAEALGVSTWAVYEAIRRGDFPIPVIRVGRRILFATATVTKLLDGNEVDM
jgi:excisionase family DNA binding protein